jgi:hypothetical protein
MKKYSSFINATIGNGLIQGLLNTANYRKNWPLILILKDIGILKLPLLSKSLNWAQKLKYLQRNSKLPPDISQTLNSNIL